jgi:ribonuclease HI
MATFDLFTDGACEGNPGPGGWAFVLRGTDGEREQAGGETSTTNNRMELTAVIEGLQQVPAGAEVTLHSDSQYVTKGLSEWLVGWKRRGWRTTSGPVKNADLWKRLDILAAERTLRTVWVRGHDGHVENERCDRLAVAAVPRPAEAARRPRR